MNQEENKSKSDHHHHHQPHRAVHSTCSYSTQGFHTSATTIKASSAPNALVWKCLVKSLSTTKKPAKQTKMMERRARLSPRGFGSPSSMASRLLNNGPSIPRLIMACEAVRAPREECRRKGELSHKHANHDIVLFVSFFVCSRRQGGHAWLFTDTTSNTTSSSSR